MRSSRMRGGVEFGLIALACMLVAAAVIGSGITQSALAIPDPLTWLSNKDGHVTRVNPDTGRPVDRLLVAAPGDALQVQQGDGILTVTNLRTDEVTVVDLSMLSFNGTRRGNPGVEVLLNQGRIFLVDRAIGRVERLDPLTAATVGEPLRLETPLADAAVDQTGSIWLLDNGGQLIETGFSDAAARFAERGRRALRGGEKAVLVAHEQGVTVFDPASGTVTQTGTGEDLAVQTRPLDGSLIPAQASPAGLVPAAAPDASAVVIMHDGTVSTVDSAALGCRQLGKPAVYRNLVHVPCLGGARKVLVLDASGRPAGPPIATPAGGDPELVLNAGLLIVNVPGADNGLVIKPNGTVTDIRTRDPQVPVVDPTKRPTALPSSLKSKTPRPSPAGSPGNTPRPSSTAGPGNTTAPTGRPTPAKTSGPPAPVPSSPVPPRPQDQTPTAVTAQARADGTVLVSWTPPVIRPASYRILRSDTGDQLAVTDGTAASAIVTGLPLGQPVAFLVEAVAQDGAGYRSTPSNAVAAYGRPGAPNIASAQIPQRLPQTLTLQINIDVTSDGGTPVTAYDLSVSDGRGVRAQAQGIPIDQRPYSVNIGCGDPNDLCLAGGGITIAATVHNAAGSGPSGTATSTIPPSAPFNYNANTQVLIVSAGLKCWTFGFTLQTCDPGDVGQLWVPHNRGWIQTSVNGQCITTAAGGTLRFAGSGCDQRPRRWNLLGQGGNNYILQNQEDDIGKPCLYAMGDPAAGGTPIRVRPCRFDASERWNFFAPSQPVILQLSGTTAAVAGSWRRRVE